MSIAGGRSPDEGDGPLNYLITLACNHSTGSGLACAAPTSHQEQHANSTRDQLQGYHPSPSARDAILKEIERLETHNQRITGCRVAVIAPSHKHRHGTGFQVHIWLTIPPHENIVVNHSPVDDARREHVEVAIKDAFAAVRRQVDALAA